MSMDEWTPEAIRAYERAIRRAPIARRKAEVSRQRKLDRLFNRLHGDSKENVTC